METTIVTPIWDATETQSYYTQNFVLGNLTRTRGDFNLCLVDNGSTSWDTIDFLSTMSDLRVHIIRNKSNRGYGGAANQGIRWGMAQGSQYFVVTNNDIEIVDHEWLEHGFVAPLRANPKQLLGARLIGFNEATRFNGQIVPYLEGWMLAFDRSFVEQVGYFDEHLLAFFEDVDWSMRAVQAGFPLVQSPDFEWADYEGMPRRYSCVHLYGQTGYRRPDFDWRRVTEESRAYMLKKWNIEESSHK